MCGALADTEQRSHAELLHGRHIKNLDKNAEFSQFRRAACELPRIKDVSRLVDEVARQDDAVGKTSRARPRLFGRGRVGAGEIYFRLGWPFVAFLALRFVLIEPVRTQARARAQDLQSGRP